MGGKERTLMEVGMSSLELMAASNCSRRRSFCVASNCALPATFLESSLRS